MTGTAPALPPRTTLEVPKSPAATAMVGAQRAINNQLKAVAAMGTKTMMMTAMTMTMKLKATAAAAAAWWQQGGGGGGSGASAAATAVQQRQGQQLGGGGGSLVVVAMH
jgi:hypothetical protein